MTHINRNTCIIEMTPPRRDAENLEDALNRFAERFDRIMNSGFMATISDNVMGGPHFQPCEIIKMLNLKPLPDQVIVHINTFHTKEEIDETLSFCKETGIRDILCLTGDGSEEFHKLQPDEIGVNQASEVTSVELLSYIKKQDPSFKLAVAFNPYEPAETEFSKMKRKVDAGADYVITQPIRKRDPQIDHLLKEFPELPVVIECWLSKNHKLLADITGEIFPEDFAYDGFQTLKELKKIYPDNGNCMSMIGFRKTYGIVEEWWKTISSR